MNQFVGQRPTSYLDSVLQPILLSGNTVAFSKELTATTWQLKWTKMSSYNPPVVRSRRTETERQKNEDNEKLTQSRLYAGGNYDCRGDHRIAGGHRDSQLHQGPCDLASQRLHQQPPSV